MGKYNKIEKKLNIVLRKGMFFLILALLCVGMIAFSTNAASKNAWVTRSGKTYYYNAKGKKVTGLKKIKSKYYYFDKKGILYKKGWKTVKGSKYYFDKKNGAAAAGLKKISGKMYYLTSKGKLYGSGIAKIKGKNYYLKKGIVQTGWITLSSKTYNFNAKGVMQTSKWIDKAYYVSANGVLQKNCWIRLSDGNYYVDASGKKVKNCWLTVGEYKYYFNANGKNTHTVKVIPWEETGGDTGDPDDNGSTNDVIENNLLNRSIYCTKIENKIKELNNKISNMMFLYGIAEGHEQALAIITEAQAIVNNYNSYTATQLYNYYNGLVAKINALSLKANQVLVYYPDQSKAIFDAINEYREAQGLSKLSWSKNSLRTTRLEAGYHAYLYDGSDEQLNFLRCHHGGQISCVKEIGRMTVDEIMAAWKNSPGHNANLKDNTVYYSSVAYYTYGDSSGRIWSKCVVDLWSTDVAGLTHATPEYYNIILNSTISNQTFK